MSIRLLIVDDQASYVEACRSILRGSDELQVVGEASTAAEALQRAEELRPDLILLDIELGEDSGIELSWKNGAAGLRPAHRDPRLRLSGG